MLKMLVKKSPPRKMGHKSGQSFFEFMFGILLTVLLMLGMIEVFIWAGTDQVKIIQKHDAILREPGGLHGLTPLRQVRPVFFEEDGFADSVSGDVLFGRPSVRFNVYTH